MLRKSKGKYKWQRKATYSVNWSLNPVIISYLELLHNQLSTAEYYGIPSYYCQKQAEIQGIDEWYSDEVDLDAAHKLRMKDLEELIYIFNEKNAPDIEDYDFEIETIFGKKSESFSTVKFDVKGQEELDRYNKDELEWKERKKAGQELFGKIYQCLDW